MLPTVTRYLERLPSGLDSYPHAQVKGGAFRTLFTPTVVAALGASEALPPAIAELVGAPPAVSSWIPTAHYGALLAAVYDVCFRATGGTPAFDAWILDTTRRLFASPLYKVMFRVASVDRIIPGAAQRFGAFHRGSTLVVLEQGRGSANLRIAHPPHLFSSWILAAIGSGLRVGGEGAGAKNVTVECDVESPASARYKVRWS